MLVIITGPWLLIYCSFLLLKNDVQNLSSFQKNRLSAFECTGAVAAKKSLFHNLHKANQTMLFAFVNSWKSKQTSQKNYRTLIFLIMLGHMQKVSHF